MRKRSRKRIARKDPWEKKASRIASEFMRRYERETGTALDFSIDRVRDLDRYLEAHADLSKEEIRRVGYYFAEIWRHSFGGSYVWDKEREALAIRQGGISVYPIEKVSRVAVQKSPGALEAFAFIYAKKRTRP
ncbi:MAG: hypothetical protein O7H41_02445 [Planctomycetota bacterium]|nr:hypothetical protein [Planctomycetota bacterium]